MSDKDANQVRDPAPAPAFYQLPPSSSAPRQVASSCPAASFGCDCDCNCDGGGGSQAKWQK